MTFAFAAKASVKLRRAIATMPLSKPFYAKPFKTLNLIRAYLTEALNPQFPNRLFVTGQSKRG
jgi:hypothetical protein